MFQSCVHFPLRGVVAEVGYQTYTEGVCTLPTLYDAQVAGCLCQALPEAQAAVIFSEGMSLKVACREKENEKSEGQKCAHFDLLHKLIYDQSQRKALLPLPPEV